MLVLSRRIGESIVVGGEVVVTVIEVGRGRVQLGVVAPSHVSVFRNEIVERMIARGEIENCSVLAGDSESLATR